MKKELFLPINLWIFLANLLIALSAVALIMLNRGQLPPQIPLWFSKPWGAERLANPEHIWLLSLIIVITFLTNNLLAKLLFKNHKTLSLIMVWAALIISLIVFFPLYRILLAVN